MDGPALPDSDSIQPNPTNGQSFLFCDKYDSKKQNFTVPEEILALFACFQGAASLIQCSLT
jgi:hypothetical protein